MWIVCEAYFHAKQSSGMINEWKKQKGATGEKNKDCGIERR